MFSGRGRRVAACTALALSAGMLLATPASADDAVPTKPRALAERQEAHKPAPRTLTLPQAGTARAGVQAADATSPLLADLNGDGFEDLVYRDTFGFLYSVTADGMAPFGTADDTIAKDVIPIGNQSGDERPEVLVLSETGSLVMYVDNNEFGSEDAGGNLRPGNFVGNGWQTYNKVFSPGDVDGDGRADVIGRTKTGQLYLYLGTGVAEKPLSGRILVGSGWGKFDQIVGVGDANGDGHADLYARDTAGQLFFYPGTGVVDQPFSRPTSIGGGWNTYSQIVAGGGGSVLGRSLDGTLYYYAPKGDGTLNGRVQEGDKGVWSDAAQIANAGTIPYLGRHGVNAVTTNGSWYWYDNTTTGKLSPRVAISGADPYMADLHLFSVSSVNNDGFGDDGFVIDGTLYIDGEEIGGGWGVYSAIVGPGDLTGDGKGDLVARDRSGVLWLYKGNGLGTGFAGRVSLGGGWNAFNKLLGAGDYTGDGLTDLLARTTGGDLYVYPGTGNASAPFRPRALVGSGWNTFKQLTAPGDLNADGKGDLLGVNSAGELYRYFNTSPARFAPKAKIGTGYQVYNNFS
ncbi:FG-GAP repeat domain-containing protein [Streptomyces hydrogenans]|uniref:FG-GAP repeat domain-containing protein n=1 Tax=Streptomyces hydrogenans TaxID=1873719 RepID=UPI00278BCC46|nr:VCBS repeat-containing protein [Streptomyces hydrogenans]